MLRALNRAVRRYLLRRGGAGIDTPGSLPAAQFFGRAIILATAILAVSASSDGTPPRKLTLSTASLSFGSQTVGTTGAAKPVTLTNSGTATLTISSIVTSGDYAQSNTCGTSLAASASCTISVTFTPTATGTRTGTVTITDNAPGSPQTVSLTGTGAVASAPAVTLSPTSLSFGNQTLNTTSSAQPATLTNSGTATLAISSIAISGDYAQSNTCGTSLAASASCTISVTFTPTATGTRTGTVTITDNAPGSPHMETSSGTGAAAAGPVITTLASAPSNTAATITWNTDVPANSKVEFGITSSYGSSSSDPTLVTSHSLAISGLTCNTIYHYRVISTDQSMNSTTSSDSTFTTTTCSSSGPVSDDFHAVSLNENLWTFVNPLNDATVTLNGFQAVLTIPGGSSHDPWTTNQSVRLMENIANTDFQVEVKFDSILQFPVFSSGSQNQGILVEQDSTNFLRFDVDCRGQAPVMFSATLVNGVPTVQLNASMPGGPPHWLRVKRSGNDWTMSWSRDGTTFNTAVTYTFPLNVTRIGPFGGNAGSNGPAPAFTAQIDYFFNSLSPIVPEDGVVLSSNFDRIVIDPTPPATVLEKGLADIDGDGRLDAIVGFDQVTLYGVSSPGGIFWYESPHSGVLTDPWLKHTILASGSAYEDLQLYDVNGDGAVDVIASVDGMLKWFENPRGKGLNPATDPWNVHIIGTGAGENVMALGDIDGDGKMDVITSLYIFFQDSPDSWRRTAYGGVKGGVVLLDIGAGKGAINLVAPGPQASSIMWFENPRETGGNARTDAWIAHYIGTAYNPDSEPRMATGDFNGDGLMDVVSAQGEGGLPFPSDGIILWEAPLDRRNGTWNKVTIDSSYQSAHKIWAADMDGNGTLDLVTAEQEQAVQERVSVFLNGGAGDFTQYILSTASGHNLALGDVNGDGTLDILNAPHGYFGFNHPLELFINRLK